IDEEGNCKKMGTYRVDPGYVCSMKPLYLKRNGNLLMLGCKYENHTRWPWNSCRDNSKGYLYSIDLKKKHSKVKGKDKTRCHGVEISEIVRYSETFVSPNKYIK
nr:hypothetical protein [Tanacetum cinerariifolium]